MSSGVMLSSRLVGTPIKWKKILERPSKNHTIGFKKKMKTCIMPIVRNATPSGLINARRFGIKSANKTNVVVTMKKAIQEEAGSTHSAIVYSCKKLCK